MGKLSGSANSDSYNNQCSRSSKKHQETLKALSFITPNRDLEVLFCLVEWVIFTVK